MSGWLTKAAGALRGEQPEQPDPFEAVCDCGVRHSGLRRRKPQRIICRSCGVALFVLPRDSYPPPLAPAPRVKKRRRKSRGAPVEPPNPLQQVATNVFQASEKVGRSAASAGLSLGSRIGAWGVAFLALWTPLRLTLLGIVAVCAATAAFVLLDDRSEQAVMALKTANEAGRQALAERQIGVAHEQLAAAVSALDTLDRHDDPLAREIRQLYREATALRDVLPISPLQVVAEADEAYAAGRDEEWQHTFRAQYRNRWMIIDGPVQRQASGAERGQYTIGLPLRFGPARRGVSLHVAMSALDRLSKGGKPRPVVMAVQLVGCDLSTDKQTWKLRVNSQSAFLWGTLDNYAAAGFTIDSPDEEQRVSQILAAQTRITGSTGSDAASPVVEPPRPEPAAGDGASAAWDDKPGAAP